VKGWWNTFLANTSTLSGYENKRSRLEGNAMIARQISCFFNGQAPPFGVIRPGIVEMKLLPLYLDPINATIHDSLIHMAANNAGVAPPTREQARVFISEYVKSMDLANRNGGLLAISCNPTTMDEEKAFVQRFNLDAVHIHSRSIEPFYAGHFLGNRDKPWSAELRGKILLVVHPFSVSIQRQYYRHHHGKPLFKDMNVLPRLKSLKTVPAVVSIAGSRVDHNWTTNLHIMKEQISAQQPFDFAILGCGGYGHPLAHFIVDEMRRPALYMGGGTQLLFGIRGNRWEDHEDLKSLIGPGWVHPLTNEIPPNPALVEDSAYWSQSSDAANGSLKNISQLHVLASDQLDLRALESLTHGSSFESTLVSLSIHLITSFPISPLTMENAKKIHDLNFEQGPKIVNTWPSFQLEHVCVQVLKPNPGEFTIVIGEIESLQSDWYYRLKEAWLQNKEQRTICASTYSNRAGVAAMAPSEHHWDIFSQFARRNSINVSCTDFYMSFCEIHNLQLVDVH